MNSITASFKVELSQFVREYVFHIKVALSLFPGFSPSLEEKVLIVLRDEAASDGLTLAQLTQELTRRFGFVYGPELRRTAILGVLSKLKMCGDIWVSLNTRNETDVVWLWHHHSDDGTWLYQVPKTRS
jgi:hypothetical protein